MHHTVVPRETRFAHPVRYSGWTVIDSWVLNDPSNVTVIGIEELENMGKGTVVAFFKIKAHTSCLVGTVKNHENS
jgi:hypothetical protein